MGRTISGTNYKAWQEVGLDTVMEGSEMEFVNQEEDGFEQLRGDWFIADDEKRVIISGTHGQDHSPGSSHNMSAEIFDEYEDDADNEAEYREELAKWEAMPEYTEEYEAEGSAWSVVVGNIGTVCDHENEDEARRRFKTYVEQSKSHVGRAGDETVTLFHGEEIAEEYEPEDRIHCEQDIPAEWLALMPGAALPVIADKLEDSGMEDEAQALREALPVLMGEKPGRYRMKGGYAYVADAGVNWQDEDCEIWAETGIVDADDAHVYVGTRDIDGQEYRVFRIADGSYAAQLSHMGG